MILKRTLAVSGAVIFAVLFYYLGCSGGNNPLAPDVEICHKAESASDRAVFGIYDVSINLDGTADIISLRNASFTANVTKLLETKPSNFKISSVDTSEYSASGKINLTVSITHPYGTKPGLSGFDVWGVFLHNGESVLQYGGLKYADGSGAGEAILLNPDGYTRWFNYGEFDGNISPLVEYASGKLSNLSNPSAKINPYKVFADGLGENEDYYGWITSDNNADNRGIFKAGSTNSRRYQLKFPKGPIKFQYAIIATWVPGDPSLTGNPDEFDPGDFPENANCDEAFLVRADSSESNLYYESADKSGGNFRAKIEVFDWQSANGVTNQIGKIVLVGDFLPDGMREILQSQLSSISSPSTENSEIYTIEISNCNPVASGQYPFWVIVETASSTYDQGFGTINPKGSKRASFWKSSVDISPDAPENNVPLVNYIYDSILGSPNYKKTVQDTDTSVTYYVNYSDPDSGQTHTVTWWITPDNVSKSADYLVSMPVDWSKYSPGNYDIFVRVSDGIGYGDGGPYDITLTDSWANTPPVINKIYDNILGPSNYKNPVTDADNSVSYSVDYIDPDAGQNHIITWWITPDGVTPQNQHLVTMPINWSNYPEGEYDIYVRIGDTFDQVMSDPFNITRTSSWTNSPPVISSIQDNLSAPGTYKNPVDTNNTSVTYSVNFSDPDTGQNHSVTWWITPDGVSPGSGHIVTMPVNWSNYSAGQYDIHVKVSDGYSFDQEGPYDITLNQAWSNTPPSISGIYDNINGPSGYKNPVALTDTSITYSVNYSDPDSGQSHSTTWWITPDGVSPSGSYIKTMPINWSGYSPGNYDIYVRVNDGFSYDQKGPYDITLSPPPSDPIIYVDDSNVSGPWDGTQSKPYKTIMDGINAAKSGDEVRVDDSGGVYAEEVRMKSGVKVISTNWNSSDGTNRAKIDGPDSSGKFSVLFDSVSNAELQGFRINMAGALSDTPTESQSIRVNGGSGNVIKDCYFTGTVNYETHRSIYGINTTNLSVRNCLFDQIDRSASDEHLRLYSAVMLENATGGTIGNNIVYRIHQTDGSSGWVEFIAFYFKNAQNINIKNNLVHHWAPVTGDYLIPMLWGFKFEGASGLNIHNNTVDYLDSTHGVQFILTISIGFEFTGTTTSIDFRNNIVSNMLGVGWPMEGVMAHGVKSESAITGYYCDIFNTTNNKWFGGASAGTGCITSDPQYVNSSAGNYELAGGSPAQSGDPSITDWDGGTGSRMGCKGGPGGGTVGLLTPG